MNKTKVLNKIKVFETFAGIGAQHKAISNIDNTFEVIGTSEWDARAIVAYASIHHKDKLESKIKEVSKWTDEEIDKYLFQRTFSLNSKSPSDPRRKPREFKNILIAANIVNNNFPDINKLAGENIKGVDLLTYSFPCQGLSIANMGRGKGIKPDVDSTSNLVWQIKRLLDDAKDKKVKLPKYLLMENVKSLIGKNHKEDYEQWKKYLKSMDYETYTFVLNGLNHGSLQKRERVFAISIQKKHKPNLTEEDMKELLLNEYSNELSIEERKEKYNAILRSSSVREQEEALPNNTPSRHKMVEENIDLKNDAKRKKYTFNTLTTKQDRHPNIGMVEFNNQETENKMHKRFITPREAYMIMGFESADFSNVKEYYEKNIITKESLYRQAGNSIVVEVIQDVFKLILDIERGKYD